MFELRVDGRIGGASRYYLAEEGEPFPLVVPDDVRKCVGFAYARLPDGERAIGTVFFVSFPILGTDSLWTYAITAKHVITGARARSVDGKVALRLNRRGGGLVTVTTDAAGWATHPDEESVDVAVLPVFLPPEMDFLSYPILASSATPALLRKHEIGVGDEVFVTGLFVNHVGTDRNIPIVRIGNIAAMPGEPVQTELGAMEAYLIEARSIGGLSGSPVFLNEGLHRVLGGTLHIAKPNPPYQTAFYFLGLVHGHYDVKPLGGLPLTREAINMGIAIVVPVWKILEVINQEVQAEMRKKVEEKLRRKNLPTMDVAPEPGVTAEQFQRILEQVSKPKPASERDPKAKGT